MAETTFLVNSDGEGPFLCQEMLAASSIDFDVITGGEDRRVLNTHQRQTINAFLHYVYVATSFNGAFVQEIRGAFRLVQTCNIIDISFVSASDSLGMIVIWNAGAGFVQGFSPL